jgi:hypothetical protein
MKEFLKGLTPFEDSEILNAARSAGVTLRNNSKRLRIAAMTAGAIGLVGLSGGKAFGQEAPTAPDAQPVVAAEVTPGTSIPEEEIVGEVVPNEPIVGEVVTDGEPDLEVIVDEITEGDLNGGEEAPTEAPTTTEVPTAAQQ